MVNLAFTLSKLGEHTSSTTSKILRWAGRCRCNVSWSTAGLHCAGEGWSWWWGAGHWDRAGYHDDGASIRSESGRTLGQSRTFSWFVYTMICLTFDNTKPGEVNSRFRKKKSLLARERGETFLLWPVACRQLDVHSPNFYDHSVTIYNPPIG